MILRKVRKRADYTRRPELMYSTDIASTDAIYVHPYQYGDVKGLSFRIGNYYVSMTPTEAIALADQLREKGLASANSKQAPCPDQS